MDEFLFTIECPTCQRRLVVKNQAAIGAILNCPKCESFVEVVPPPGWQPKPVVHPAAKDQVVAPSVKEEQTHSAEKAATVIIPASANETPAIPPPHPQVPNGSHAWFQSILPWNWPLGFSVPMAGLLVAVAAWSILWSRYGEPETPLAVEPAEQTVASSTASQEPKPATQLPTQLERRWLPNGTRLVFSLKLSDLADKPEVARAIQWGGDFWRNSVGRVLDGFRIQPRSIRRVTWAATDLSAWQDQAVVFLEFGEGQDLEVFRRVAGKPCELSIAGVQCRKMDAGWTHPFAVVGDRFLLTGPAPLLGELADRVEPKLASQAIESLLKGTSSNEDFLLLLDLKAARESKLPLPLSLMDVWPEGRQPWRTTWGLAQGLGLSLRRSDRLESELALVCEAATDVDKLQDSMEKGLLPAGKKAIDERLASLRQDLMDGRLTAEAARQYETVLREARDAIASARCQISAQTFHLHLAWGPQYSAATIAAADSAAAMRGDWLHAARREDEKNQQAISRGLTAYAKANQAFPSAARGHNMLPPESRLSWITSLLPYLDHGDWHKQFDETCQWNMTPNRAVAQRPLEQVVNPAIGPVATEAGFPATHYAGVSGFVPEGDTAKVRPGVFSFDKSVAPQDIPDGASNTIATLGVSGNLGPWAQGGPATARPLTKRPYVNGPDGFGSGQPNGMVAGMADGSVRFIAKDIAPEVIEQLATTGGGSKETATAAMLDPKPRPAPKPSVVATPPSVPDATKAPNEKTPVNTAQMKQPAAIEPTGTNDGRADAAPVKIDVPARLADPVAEIDFPNVPLVDAVRLISGMSTVLVTFDLDAMADAGVGLRDPITVHLADTSVHKILEAIAASRKLACVVDGDQVVFTSPQRSAVGLHRRTYDVADLVQSRPDSADELIRWIVKLVAPEAWRQAGGAGSIRISGTTVVVEQSDRVHRQVRRFCDNLRVARGLSVPDLPDKAALASRPEQARPKLQQPVTLNLFAKTPLVRVLAELEQLGQVTIVIDWASLASAGIGPDVRAAVRVNQKPLEEALLQALLPAGLFFRVIGPDTFEVTTRKAAEARMEIEFYPVADLLRNGLTPDALIERVKSQVAGASWSDAGGPGLLEYDRLSGHLMVLQSQPNQRQIEDLLRKATAPREKGKAATFSRIRGTPLPRR